MSEFEKGDRVLLDVLVDRVEDDFYVFHYRRVPIGDATRPIQPHPGVPVQDLLEELEGLWTLKVMLPMSPELQSFENGSRFVRVRELQKNREAVSKPKYTEGQAVWVRGRIENPDGGCGNIGVSVGGYDYAQDFTSDDIRPVEPPD